MKSSVLTINIFAFSTNGVKLSDTLINKLHGYDINAFAPEKYLDKALSVKPRKEDLTTSTERAFETCDAIIFVGALGITVRAIAPFVKSKKYDPAVICIDERGKNVISVLSGHIGGANRLTLKIAELIGANPVITTATDVNGKFAVDEWATNHNLYIENLTVARDIAANILEDKTVGIYSDFEILGNLPAGVTTNPQEIGISVSIYKDKMPFKTTLKLTPKIVAVGVGCRKNTDYNDIYYAVKTLLDNYSISYFSIKSINSIDLKKEETGIIKTAEIFKVPFYTYSSEELNKIEGNFSNSNFVKSITGIDSVCERAAVMGSNSKKLLIKKTVINSVTVAVCLDDYVVDFR